MTRIALLFVLLLLTLVSSYEKNKCKDDDPMQRFATALMEITGKFLYKRLEQYPDQSYTYVALPLACILGQLALHAKDDEAKKIMYVLNLNSKEEIKTVLRSTVNFVNEMPSSRITFKMFRDDCQKFDKSFEQDFTDICNGESGHLDYDLPKQALEIVNQWFAAQTSYNVVTLSNLTIFDGMDKKGLLYVTSMDYLYDLDNPNNPSGFKEIDFQVSKCKSLKFPAIYGNGYFKYGNFSDIDARFIKILLKGGNNSAMFFCPNNASNLLGMMEQLQDPDIFYGVERRAKWMCLNVYITIGFTDLANDLFEYVPELHLNSTKFVNVFKNGQSARVNLGIQQLHLFQAPQKKRDYVNSKRCPGDGYQYLKLNTPCAYYVQASNNINIYAGILNGPQSYGL